MKEEEAVVGMNIGPAAFPSESLLLKELSKEGFIQDALYISSFLNPDTTSYIRVTYDIPVVNKLEPNK